MDEGVTLRCAGIAARILVMAGFLPVRNGPAIVEYDLTPAVHSLEDIAELDRLALAPASRCAYHLKIEAACGGWARARSRRRSCRGIACDRASRTLEGLMTHFASRRGLHF